MLGWFLFDLVLSLASVNLSCLIKSDLLFSGLHVFCFSHFFNVLPKIISDSTAS